MSDLQFAAPEWGYALWGVLLVVALLVWLERRGGAALDRFVAAPMRERLVAMPTPLARWTRLLLLGVAAVALVVALMRPQWGIEFVMAPQVGAEIMIALDVSKSMLAEDVVPNRLERAKAEIRDLLPYLDGDQVGLIAFAGRASVLCPLTPDFSFLRLVLDQVDTTSVSRGGTRLEEPIRKAVAGFGPSGDLARVILLITDGEDHDSFPLDAARDAAERGIRILAIGFGDEAGSRIAITDPRSGARVYVEDAAGRPVISRLDGELLRELAVITEGAYVPAGTGVLDLESIFEAHIRPLMRGEGEARGKTVRKDGFQWGVLVALLALFGSLLTRARRIRLPVIALLLALVAGASDDARAQPAPSGTPSASALQPDADAPAPPIDATATSTDAHTDTSTDTTTVTADAAPATPEDPREAYNEGIAAFDAGGLDTAETRFEAARSSARRDGELRFRATYNLGWVDVARADGLMEAAPEDALGSLERAADWFREAIALRPASDAARRNLEIVLARSLALADSLEQRDAKDVRARLEALIAAQRDVTGAIRGVVERIQLVDDPNAADMLRPAFKAVAVQEREILAEASALNELAGQEQDALEARAEEELTTEERMRQAQLAGVLHYLHRARERIGQARSQLRQRQGERAHRRAAAGLADLERAREQLLDPVQILDGLVRDTAQLHREAMLLDQSRLAPLGAPGSPAPTAPDWLTERYLGDLQDAALERSGELNARLSAGLSQADTATDPAQQAVLAQVEAAQPFVARAAEHLATASDQLAAAALTPATDAQREALTALVDARERFLDLKGLIEVAYADEARIAGVLGAGVPGAGAEPQATPPAEHLAELAPALAGLQAHNLERLLRMSPMLAALRAQLDAAGADPEGQLDEAERAEQAEQLELADGILAVTEAAMQGAAESLARLAETDTAVEESRASVASAQKGLENLRRLFFSIVEHIRDTARQQVALGDRTEAAAGADADRRPARIGPVQSHQDELAARTESLANALHEQSFADPAEILGPEAAKDPETAEAAAARLAEASEHVLAASETMARAAEGLDASEPDFEAVRGAQDEAVNKLAQALALLEPEQQQQDSGQDEQQQQEQQEQQEQQQQEQQEQQQEQQSEQDAGEQDPTQLLQSVRDREAERHRRNRDRPKGYEPVDKDW